MFDLNKSSKIILTVTLTLVLGAIGSGIWERVGGPLFDFTSRFAIDSITLIFKSYKDSIYIEAANGFTERGSIALYLVLLSCLPFIYVILLSRHPIGKERRALKGDSDQVRDFIRGKSGFIFLILMTIFVFGFVTVSLTRETYIRSVVLYAETTIDRLSPYVGDQEEKKLISQLRSVRNADDYYAFYGHLQTLLKQNSLPDYGQAPL